MYVLKVADRLDDGGRRCRDTVSGCWQRPDIDESKRHKKAADQPAEGDQTASHGPYVAVAPRNMGILPTSYKTYQSDATRTQNPQPSAESPIIIRE